MVIIGTYKHSDLLGSLLALACLYATMPLIRFLPPKPNWFYAPETYGENIPLMPKDFKVLIYSIVDACAKVGSSFARGYTFAVGVGDNQLPLCTSHRVRLPLYSSTCVCSVLTHNSGNVYVPTQANRQVDRHTEIGSHLLLIRVMFIQRPMCGMGARVWSLRRGVRSIHWRAGSADDVTRW